MLTDKNYDCTQMDLLSWVKEQFLEEHADGRWNLLVASGG